MRSHKYKHLFFDLDRTLWDFDSNNIRTFAELYDKFELARRGVSDLQEFYIQYQKINVILWEEYKYNRITKEMLNFQRFNDILAHYNITDSGLAREMGTFYITVSPLKTILYPQTIETLEILHQKYQMHIITNGFEEVQYIKIENSGLGKYFDKIITSERAGCKKPERGIFDFALKETGANVLESIIIGDDPDADILGASLVGMDQIWVKHPPVHPILRKPTYEVSRISDITMIL
jgi:putative hydrolase of the HAD superfamily